MDTDKKNEADTNFTNFHEFLEGENAKRDCNETTDKHRFYRRDLAVGHTKVTKVRQNHDETESWDARAVRSGAAANNRNHG
jgi:hypothetical protein